MADIATLNIQVSTAEVKGATNDLSKLEIQGVRAERSIDDLSRTAKKLAVYFSLWKAGSFIKDAALLAARYETLGVTMRTAGKNAGYAQSQMSTLEKQLQSQGIAAVEAREVLTRMAAAYMDLSQAGELAADAQNLAVAGGINSSQAFERMVYAIQSGQTEMLRTLGLNVSFEESYKKLAGQLGKTVDALTQEEKMQARANAVHEKAVGYVGLYEDAMKTAGKQITSFARYWQDMQLELGRSQLPAVTQTVELLKTKLKEATEYLSQDDVQRELAGIGETAIATAEDLLKIGAAAGKAFNVVLTGWNNLPTIVQEIGIVGALIGGVKAKAALLLLITAMGQLEKFTDQSREAVSGGAGIESQIAMEMNRLATLQEQYAQLNGTDLETFGPGYQQQIRESMDLIARLQERLDEISDARNRDTVGKIHAGSVTGPDLEDVGTGKPSNDDDDTLTTTKMANAIESLTAKLAAMNDVGTEGEARIAALTKEYNAFSKTLGATHPQVMGFAEAIEYANEHYGHTPAEVAKATRAVEENVSALEAQIVAVTSATDAYGKVDQDVLSMATAKAEAERDYTQAILDGVDPVVAARQRDLEVQLAQVNAKRKDLQVLTEFHKEYIRVVKGETEFKIAQIEEQARVWLQAGADEIAVAEWAAQRKLEVSRDWADGAVRHLRDYADEATNLAENVGGAFTDAFQGMEDALVDFVTTGKLDFSDLANSIISDLARIAVRQSITGPLASGMNTLIDTLFNAHGNVLSGPGISALSNGIYSSPTYFGYDRHITRFSSGGVLGEAGTEGVFPLARTAGGDLGVKAIDDSTPSDSGESVQPVQVNFSVVAADSQSFQQQMVQNRQVIIGIVQQAFNQRGKAGPRDSRRS